MKVDLTIEELATIIKALRKSIYPSGDYAKVTISRVEALIVKLEG